MFIQEEWRDTEFWGYQISNLGNVRSIDRFQTNSDGKTYHYKAKYLHPVASKGRNNDGYMIINLRQRGKSNTVTVHSLVAKAFLENPNNLPVINHIDGNKRNNCVDNLEYTTYAYNNIHALNNNLRKPRGVPIAQYDIKDRLINTFVSVAEASRQTGISIGSISHCVNNRTFTAGGYKWKKLSSQSTIENIK